MYAQYGVYVCAMKAHVCAIVRLYMDFVFIYTITHARANPNGR